MRHSMRKPVVNETNKKLRIGFVLDTSLDIPDGVQQYVLTLSNWLRDHGHEVHYLVGETHRTDLEHLHSVAKNFTVKFNGNAMTIPMWANRTKVKKLLSEFQYDVIHVQSPHHPLMAQYIVKNLPDDTAVVTTFHILPYNKLAAYMSRLLGLSLGPSLKRTDAMLAVSSSAATFAESSYRLPTRVSPNVFDYSRFKTASRLSEYSRDTVTILFLGRLVERKGCQYLLKAIAGLDRSALPAFRVIICGKGEQLEQLQEYVHNNGLADVVEFAGFVSEEDKPRYYASADISVFPSTAGESFGIVLLEAMASGSAAVLAGNNPGYETVMDPHPNLLFDPKNTPGFTKLLQFYIENPSERQEVATWGTEYVKAFDVEVVGPKVVKIYENAIAKRRTSQHNEL